MCIWSHKGNASKERLQRLRFDRLTAKPEGSSNRTNAARRLPLEPWTKQGESRSGFAAFVLFSCHSWNAAAAVLWKLLQAYLHPAPRSLLWGALF